MVRRREAGAVPSGVRPLILFDLDDTLYDRSYVTREVLRTLGRREPTLRRRPLSELAAEYARLLEETHLNVLRGRTDARRAREERYARLLAYARGTPAADDLRRARHLAEIAGHASGRFFRAVPGATQLVRRLAAVASVGVLTNQYRDEQVPKLGRLGITDAVAVLACLDDTLAVKPDPAAFRWAMAAAGVGPESTVMVGDSWATDVLGANAAGIAAFWLDRDDRPVPDPQVSVTRLRSFLPVGPTSERLLRAVRADRRRRPNGS